MCGTEGRATDHPEQESFPQKSSCSEELKQRKFSQGQDVMVFYHANDHILGRRFCKLKDDPWMPGDRLPSESVVFGLSTGWIQATVAEDYDPADGNTGVLVLLIGLFADAYHEDQAPVNNMYWRAQPSWIRPLDSFQPVITLSLLVVRWWNYQYGSKQNLSHSVTSEQMLLEVLEGPGSAHAAFGETGSYEVYSMFVRNTSDLQSVDASFAAKLRGQHRAALYFLWPTCRLTKQRQAAAYVAEGELFELMRRMEQGGIHSCWPHPASLYRELAGKNWAPRTCQSSPELHVPATVQVSYGEWQVDPAKCAQAAVSKLCELKSGCAHAYRGVAKLTFSWMGEDVLPFTGVQGLCEVLERLFSSVQPGAVCLVQERIEDVLCELRVVCCRDDRATTRISAGVDGSSSSARSQASIKPVDVFKMEVVRMRLRRPTNEDKTFSLTSGRTLTHQEAVEVFGTAHAVQLAEAEALRLANLWLEWFRAEGRGVPTVCRLDFLAAKIDDQISGVAPQVGLWTIELSECGSSMCGLPVGPRTTAILNDCLLGCESGVYPLELPSLSVSVVPTPCRQRSHEHVMDGDGVPCESPVCGFGFAQGLKVKLAIDSVLAETMKKLFNFRRYWTKVHRILVLAMLWLFFARRRRWAFSRAWR